MTAGKHQNKCVSVYWARIFLEGLDSLCRRLSVRRNDFIKEAVREKIQRELKKLGISANELFIKSE